MHVLLEATIRASEVCAMQGAALHSTGRTSILVEIDARNAVTSHLALSRRETGVDQLPGAGSVVERERNEATGINSPGR